MKNFGRHECMYDGQQADCNCSIRVSNADGKPVRYVAGSFQTFGHSKSIAPERTVVLFDDLDLASQYLFVKPGSYMLQFRGTNVKWDSESEIPPSNTITVQMQPGTMPLSMQVPARLVEILPKGWDMSLNGRVSELDDSGKITPPGYDSGCGTYLSLNRGAQDKRDVLRVEVWVAEKRLTWTGKFQAGKVRKPGEAATYLGKGADGHVYWTVPEKAETEWPDIRTKVGAALQIGPHVQGTGTSD
jgi:hypothetical protein